MIFSGSGRSRDDDVIKFSPCIFPIPWKFFMSELDQLPVLTLLNKARNELRRVFGVVWCITALFFWRLKICDLHGPDMAMTSSTTSGKNHYFSEILETTRNTIQKTVCQYLLPVPRNLWQKLYQLKKNWPNSLFKPRVSHANSKYETSFIST